MFRFIMAVVLTEIYFFLSLTLKPLQVAPEFIYSIKSSTVSFLSGTQDIASLSYLFLIMNLESTITSRSLFNRKKWYLDIKYRC